MAKPKQKPVEGIGPTPERRRQVKIDVVASLEKGGKAHRVRNPWSIDQWLEKGRITRDEHTVAEHYANAYHRAFGSNVQISRYNPDPVLPASGIAAQHDLTAMRQLWARIGPIHARWLDGVIIMGESITSLERVGSVRNGTGLEHFRAALHEVARVWGLPICG